MFRLAVVLGLVAFCAAKNPIDHCCSAEDRNIVQEQWKVLWKDAESSKIKIGFGRKVVLKLVELKPETKDLFVKYADIEHPDGGKFQYFTLRIFQNLDMLINLLKDPEALDAAIEHLADKHARIPGIKQEHFKTFGEILAAALPRVLDEYNALSWKSCFRHLLTGLASKLSE